MQKISTYLYPNRIQLLADLAGFNVEYTNVYQRTVKVYKGVDNVLEFDIKNADEKRIELLTSPVITDLTLNVMDISGNALPNSPYTVTPSSSLKGIASATIPAADLAALDNQFLQFSVTATKDANTIPLYGDSRFGAVGSIELAGSAMPITRKDRVFTDFTAEIDLKGNPIFHSSSIPTKFYEAVKTETLSFDIHVVGFTGSVWIDAAKSDTLSVESWRQAGRPFGSWIWSGDPFTGTIPFAATVPVGDYTYFRVSYQSPTVNGMAAIFNVTRQSNTYGVTIQAGGTGYGIGALIKVPGSQLGGADGTNDLILTVTGIEGGGNSYTVSAITSVGHIGVAADGTGTYLVSGVNYSGSVDKITVS